MIAKAFRTGLVVGKFSPLHHGHEELVRVALANSARLVVVSWSKPEYAGCEASRRRLWLQWRFGGVPGVECHVLAPEDFPDMPDNDAAGDLHRAFAVRWLVARGYADELDAVFTSEEYGDGFAAFLTGALGHPVRHVSVDPGRVRVPVSATAVRAGTSMTLDPQVLADYLGGRSR
jgi:hypothetical protein